MMDIFWYFISSLTFISVLMALLLIYRYYLGNRLIAQSNKLKSQIANLKRDYPELEDNRRAIVGGAIGEIGIDGVLDELGIPSAIKPLARGFIDKIAQNPEMIKGFAEKLGVRLPDDTKQTEIPLL